MTRGGDAELEGEPVDDPLPSSADDLPPIDFSTLLVSLRTSALVHMGHGQGGASELNLPLARQDIELLVLLEDKTRGNLSAAEQRLLSQILFDLKTRYVAARTG